MPLHSHIVPVLLLIRPKLQGTPIAAEDVFRMLRQLLVPLKLLLVPKQSAARAAELDLGPGASGMTAAFTATILDMIAESVLGGELVAAVGAEEMRIVLLAAEEPVPVDIVFGGEETAARCAVLLPLLTLGTLALSLAACKSD